MRLTPHQKTHHLTQCFVKHDRIHHIPYTSVHGPTQLTQNSSSAHKTYTHTFLTWGTEYMTLSRNPQIITPPPSNNFQETQHPHTKHNINIDRLPHTACHARCCESQPPPQMRQPDVRGTFFITQRYTDTQRHRHVYTWGG